MNKKEQQTCDRCHAAENGPHPIYKFVVKLNKIDAQGQEQNVCQYCEIRVQANKKIKRKQSILERFFKK